MRSRREWCSGVEWASTSDLTLMTQRRFGGAFPVLLGFQGDSSRLPGIENHQSERFGARSGTRSGTKETTPATKLPSGDSRLPKGTLHGAIDSVELRELGHLGRKPNLPEPPQARFLGAELRAHLRQR